MTVNITYYAKNLAALAADIEERAEYETSQVASAPTQRRGEYHRGKAAGLLMAASIMRRTVLDDVLSPIEEEKA